VLVGPGERGHLREPKGIGLLTGEQEGKARHRKSGYGGNAAAENESIKGQFYNKKQRTREDNIKSNGNV